MFHIFSNQEERRNHSGSAFIEIQFCKLPEDCHIKKILESDSIKHWQNDSLYVSDESAFYKEYSQIFNCGVYNNLQRGTVDIYGVNYYEPFIINDITERLNEYKPTGYEVLTSWLEKAKEYNGFYILGI